MVEITRVEFTFALGPTKTEDGRNVTTRPFCETMDVRTTVPLKPLMLVTVTLDELDPPGRRVTKRTGSETLKSTTMTVTVVELVCKPLVPVTVISYAPKARLSFMKTVQAEEAIPLAGGVTTCGLHVTPGPDGCEVAVRLTGALKPRTLWTAIVKVPEDPSRIFRVVGLEVRTKLETLVTNTLTLVQWKMEPLTPVTFTLYVPNGVVKREVTVRVDLPTAPGSNETLVGLSVAVGQSVPGHVGTPDTVGPPDTVAFKETVPVKPRLVTTTVEVPELPWGNDREGMVEDKVKSTTLIVMRKLWEREPLVPVTVTMNDPGIDEVNVKVEVAVVALPVAPSVTVAGVMETAEPAGFAKDASNTVPEKPSRL